MWDDPNIVVDNEHLEELGYERWCPACKMRYRVGPPKAREFSFIGGVDWNTYAYLLAAAREFDETAERLTPREFFTAVDFLDWLKPSLVEVAA